MKTPVLIGLTVVGTVAVFSTGGLVAMSFMKQAMSSAARPAIEAAAPAPAPMPQVVTAPAETMARLQPTPVAVPAVPEPVLATAEPIGIDAPKEKTTEEILAQLKASAKANQVQEKEVVIYDFVSASQSEEQFDTAIPERLKNAVFAELDKGMSVDQLGVMVQNAVDLGLVDAPAALSTNDGKPDARAILLAIVNEHEKATGQVFQKTALGVDGPSPLASGRNHTYVVEAGDSLAYLALKFYGNTADYRVIFNANRSKIQTPDNIQVGQRLIIPAI